MRITALLSGLACILALYASPVLSQEPGECSPPCRAGFVCLNGTCVSRCNPPCPIGSRCTDGADCVAQTESVTPAPAPATAPRAKKRKAPRTSIACNEVFIVRPNLEARFSPEDFTEGELFDVSEMIANAICPVTTITCSQIDTLEIGAVRTCNAPIVVASVASYYKEPSRLGQFRGNIVIRIATFRSCADSIPERVDDYSGRGDPHWGDSTPLFNAAEAVCRKIRRSYRFP